MQALTLVPARPLIEIDANKPTGSRRLGRRPIGVHILLFFSAAMMGHALPLSLVASTSAVSQLKWVGDYQTGDWGTDAAESLAYDEIEKRAFIASAAGSGSVTVVDVTDPVNMQEISTILAGPTASQLCEQQSCFYEILDFSGGSAPCGYAPVIGMVFDKGDCSACNPFAVADAATQTGSGATTGVCDPGDCKYTSIPTTSTGDMSVDARAATPEGCKAMSIFMCCAEAARRAPNGSTGCDHNMLHEGELAPTPASTVPFPSKSSIPPVSRTSGSSGRLACAPVAERFHIFPSHGWDARVLDQVRSFLIQVRALDAISPYLRIPPRVMAFSCLLPLSLASGPLPAWLPLGLPEGPPSAPCA